MLMKSRMPFFLWFLLIIQINYALSGERPFWLIAHMVNGKDQVIPVIDEGANALEADIRFYKNGTVYRSLHGFPCDCLRSCTHQTEFGEFLDHLREVGGDRSSPNYRKEFCFIQLDLKLYEDLYSEMFPAAARSLAETLVQHYWEAGIDPESLPYILLGTEYTDQTVFITEFLKYLDDNNRSYLRSRFGFEFSLRENITKIMAAFESINIRQNIWMGDGISNCISYLRPTGRVREAIEKRDSPSGTISKVYSWTIDQPRKINSLLDLGVDGMLTNDVPTFRKLLDMRNSTYRMATRDDNPWQKFQSF